MKKKLNPIEEYATQIVREIGRWNYILENGCNDPFWPDGTNMNLTRNHISVKSRNTAKQQERSCRLNTTCPHRQRWTRITWQ